MISFSNRDPTLAKSIAKASRLLIEAGQALQEAAQLLEPPEDEKLEEHDSAARVIRAAFQHFGAHHSPRSKSRAMVKQRRVISLILRDHFGFNWPEVSMALGGVDLSGTTGIRMSIRALRGDEDYNAVCKLLDIKPLTERICLGCALIIPAASDHDLCTKCRKKSDVQIDQAQSRRKTP